MAGIFAGEESWQIRGKDPQTSSKTKESKVGVSLRSIANRLTEQNQDYLSGKTKEIPTFPVISYYGTGRLWSVSRLTKGKKHRLKE
jgi:predicted ATP-binding protein involved in virulence